MSDFFCAAPWKGVHVNLDGDVRVCCAGRPGFLGNINQSSIHDILSSSKLKELRSTLKQGIGHSEYCKGCIDRNNSGHTERQWHNDTSKEFSVSGASIDEPHLPAIVDIRWNNTCNLSCSYCSPYFSSTWGNLTRTPNPAQVRSNYDELLEFVVSNSSSVRDVAMLGGEPLLINENARLLETLPDPVQITIITNSAIDLENSKVFNQLKKRKNVHWRISLDNTHQQYEYVRYEADWNQLINNINKIKNLNHRMGVHSVYSIYNCTRLVEFRKEMAKFVDHVQWQQVYPDYLNPAYFEDSVKQLARQEISNLFLQCQDMLGHDEKVFFEFSLDQFDNISSSSNFEFQNHVNKIEQLRGQHNQFIKLWPELSFTMEKYNL